MHSNAYGACMRFTKRERDCLIAMLDSNEIRLSRLSNMLGITAPTAYALAERLIKKNAIERDSNNLLRLTAIGKNEAKGILFRHRVLETLLVNNGTGIEEACEECKKIDYLLSPKLADELFESLHRPCTCPHGKKIEK